MSGTTYNYGFSIDEGMLTYLNSNTEQAITAETGIAVTSTDMVLICFTGFEYVKVDMCIVDTYDNPILNLPTPMAKNHST
jgi:hypothetical protein